MGARIFIRHARGYTLTELGEDVLRVAQKTEELIEDLAGRVEGGKDTLEGELKLTILAGFAELIMKPISDFRAEIQIVLYILMLVKTSRDLNMVKHILHCVLVQNQIILITLLVNLRRSTLTFTPTKAIFKGLGCQKILMTLITISLSYHQNLEDISQSENGYKTLYALI